MCFESFSVPTFVHKPYRILTSFNRTQKKISNRSPFPLAHNFPSPSSLETRQREIGTHMDKDIWTLDKGQIALLLCSGMDGLGIQLLDEKGEEKLRGWGKVVQKDAAKPNDGDIICQNKLFDMPAHRSESAWPSAHHPRPHPPPDSSHAQREIILLKGIHRSFVLVARKNDIFKVSQNDRRFVWKKDCKNELLNG